MKTKRRSGWKVPDWSRSYDRKLEDLLTVQQELSELIAMTLEKQLAKPGAGAAGTHEMNLEAHDLYLLGRYQWHRFEDMAKAIGYFEKAIALLAGVGA